MAAGHSEGAERGEFCSLRMEECPCGNKYRNIMLGTESWGKYPQRHRTLTVVERSPEAHHVLPVAAVTSDITANPKIRDEVVKNTKWCVNDRSNMIALPLFEMTFLHYLVANDAVEIPNPPPFANLPMHNYGHNSFQKDVSVDLKNIGTDAEKDTANHDEVATELLAKLNKLRDRYKTKLVSRGERGKGTHGEFLCAMNAEKDDKSVETWYIPFSMAKKPAKRPFPIQGKKSGIHKKLTNLIEAFGNLDD